MNGKTTVARVAVWSLVNLSGLALAVAALAVNNALFGPQTSMWTSAWATAVAGCAAYAVIEKAPVLATAIGTRRTLADWALEMADRVADWAELGHCGQCGGAELAEYTDETGSVGAYGCQGCGNTWLA